MSKPTPEEIEETAERMFNHMVRRAHAREELPPGGFKKWAQYRRVLHINARRVQDLAEFHLTHGGKP